MVSVILASLITMLTPLATPMITATLSRSLQPLMKVSMNSSSPIRAITATITLAARNTPASSGNHQPMVGQMVMPRSSQARTPQIMIRKDTTNTTRINFLLVVSSGRLSMSVSFRKNFRFSSAWAYTRDLVGSLLTFSA